MLGWSQRHAEYQRSLVMIFQSVRVGHAVIYGEVSGQSHAGPRPTLAGLARRLVPTLGVGRRLLLRCLEESRPEGEIAASLGHPQAVSGASR